MKKVFLFLLALLILMVLISIISTNNCGSERFHLSRNLAHYLVENDYRFPKSWDDYEEYYYVKKFGVPSKSKRNSELNGKYVLPWGESLTNDVVLTSTWFKSIDRQYADLDFTFCASVLGEIFNVSTNKVLKDNIVRAFRANQQKTVSQSHEERPAPSL